MSIKATLPAIVLIVAAAGHSLQAQGPVVIRAAHFPNITHAQGVIGQATGWFEKALAPDAKIKWNLFNSGPDVIEAVFAGALDIAYIGPNPAINGYVRSHGQALRIIAGAASGGVALVVRADSGIWKPQDFHGKRVATPQLGGTQDIALRAWLLAHGMKTQEEGGDVQVEPTANPNQLLLFTTKQIDAAWAPEPWASRLIDEAHGRLFLDERSLWPNGQFATTELIVSTHFLTQHRDLVQKWVRAHVELTEWILKNPADARRILNQELQKEAGAGLPENELNDGWSRLQITYDPLGTTLETCATRAFDDGFLGRVRPDISGIYDLSMLNEVLRETGAPPISPTGSQRDDPPGTAR